MKIKRKTKNKRPSPACHTRTASHRPQALMQPPCRTSQVICLGNAELADLHRRPAVQSLRCGLCACCLFYAEQGKADEKQKLLRDRALLVVFSVRPLLREPLHRPMCAARSTTRMPFSTNRLWYHLVLWSTRASMTDRIKCENVQVRSTSIGCECCTSDRHSLLRPVPAITCIHASTPHRLYLTVMAPPSTRYSIASSAGTTKVPPL